jgi:hypothetical protein
VHESDSRQWGSFRRPALLGPAIGFLAFLGSEAVRSPGSGIGDSFIWLPIFLVIATIFAAIPYLIGAFLLLVVFRGLPIGLVRFTALRLVLGAGFGAFVAWPFGNVLNWIPSATADQRFNMISMLVGGSIAGAFCAGFFAETHNGSPSSKSPERPHE